MMMSGQDFTEPYACTCAEPQPRDTPCPACRGSGEAYDPDTNPYSISYDPLCGCCGGTGILRTCATCGKEVLPF